ncbi:MAG: TetR/AcrR family transcriptional regulator [Citrobacter freundii]|nr:MAG: TetR/AcrR family transcriptional regulator [Citrobacter freundii]
MTKAEKTRQFIIEQSAPLFNTKGLAGTSMSDIMEATGMAKGGLYGHFETKEDLSYAVVDYNTSQVGLKLRAAIGKAKTAKGKLEAALDFFSNPMKPPVEGGCPLLNFGMEADDTNQVIRKKIKNGIDETESVLQKIIEEGIASGEFKNTNNAREMAIKMFAMIEGATMICRVAGHNNQMKIIIDILRKDLEMMTVKK